ncbi:MAG: SAM-dependent methyltransferase [Candidatus Brocadiia bacterium]
MEQGELLDRLLADEHLLQAVELLGPHGELDARKDKKLREVAGFCQVILRYVDKFLRGRDRLRIVEFSCGKSYLGLLLCVLLRRLAGRDSRLVGIDINEELIAKCRRLADEVGLTDACFVTSRTLDFDSDEQFDLAVSLHACDTATDEAIAKGIQIGAHLIMVVPCCQNQIRGQIKAGHELTPMTEFGVARYRLANLLTDTLRAQFLRAAGYYVEMDEIASPRLTPKNLCICARMTRRGARPGLEQDYLALRSFFEVKPALERFCPEVIGRQPD